MREIYVRKGEITEIAVVEDGRLVEYVPDDGASSADVICLGRVERIMPGMKAAFVNIGQEKCGFLPLEERTVADLPKLQTGMAVIVQIRKEAQGVKGAFLSRDISLCGEYVLLMPMGRQVAVSSRISTESTRKRVKALGKEIARNRFGLVMRSASRSADESAIAAEAEELFARWESICKAAPTAHVPSVLYSSRSALDALLEDYHPRGIDRIFTNDPALLKQLSAYAPTELRGDDMFLVARISNQLQNALERRVWLESGGNLVFDPCEAMTVVDVNTAKFTGKTALADTVLQTNLEACAEVARQVRLRNVSGIIIIDMIDMAGRADHQAVLAELERCFSGDRIKTVIHGFTSLGLVEMTRRRSRAPLREIMKEIMKKETYHQEENPHG